MERRRSPSNSLDKNIIKELKILLNPKDTQKKILSKRKYISIKISEIYDTLYKDNFPFILCYSRFKFLDKIKREADAIIIETSLNTSNNFPQILEAKENLMKKYETDFKYLSYEYNNFLKNKKNYKYFSHFRKHCGKTEKYAYHYCDSNKKSKFIEIKKNGEISYVICGGCKTCYNIDFIFMYCTNCNKKYFSNILGKNEDENLLPATWTKYHCNSLINEIMKCIKCKSILYLNIKTDVLICSNKRCKFNSKPENILWTCITCNKEFTSSAKIYNPLDFQVLNKAIKFALIRQIKAAPKKLPCNCTKDLSKLSFYHKEECKGELLKGYLMEKNIIVCSKCHSINFEDRFTWICPICKVKFHLHTLIGSKPFVKKKYIINRSFNRSFGFNDSKYFLIKNLKNLDISNVNRDSTNISPRNGGNITVNNINSKKIYFNNCISPLNSDRSNKDQIFDYTKKINIINPNDNRYISGSPKKKKYKTLIDILKKRQASEGGENKKKKENELNKTIAPQKNNKLKIFQVPKKEENDAILFQSKIKVNKINNRYNNIKINKNYNNINKTKNSEENNKGVLDTTDNSTFKTLSMNDQKYIYNSIHNENRNNKNSIQSYKFWESKKGKETNNNNFFNLYKNKNNKLKILKLKEVYSEQFHKSIPLKNTLNLNFINNNKKSILLFSYLNNNSKEKNKIKNENPKESSNINGKINENNNILYSYITQKNNSPSEQKDKNSKNINENKPFDNLFSFEIKSHEKEEKNFSFSSSSSSIPSKEEEKDTIKDFMINSNNKINKRESLVIRGNFRRPSILISEEKIKNLLNKTKIPSFNASDYNIICPIGEGTYGSVYLVEHNETLEQYALKKIICRDYIELLKQKEELELIFSVKHENILNLYGIQFKYLDETTSSINVLMELANSDWNKEIKKRFLAKKYYKEKEIIILLKQIIKGFLYLQDKNIAHRDIKPQNILLFPNNIYKIADFGEAKFIKNIKEQSTLRGSELFMSPLLYKGYKYNQKNVLHNPFKSDVFSLGYCLIYAMCLNLNVLDALRELTTMKSIINCINKFLMPNTFSEKLINLVYKMIEPNEDLRFDFEDLSNELKKYN